MGNRIPASILVRLADAAGNSMEVSDAGLAQAFLKNYTDAIGRPAVTAPAHPWRLGELVEEQGGLYAGVMRGREKRPDAHIFVHPDQMPKADNWINATDWAGALRYDAFADYALPWRPEQSLLFANVPELFEKEWYWSCEPSASNPANAWVQGFSSGLQSTDWKNSSDRARAVRRIPL